MYGYVIYREHLNLPAVFEKFFQRLHVYQFFIAIFWFWVILGIMGTQP